jgi:tetratricopeptide (TPR) repeat protein
MPPPWGWGMGKDFSVKVGGFHSEIPHPSFPIPQTPSHYSFVFRPLKKPLLFTNMRRGGLLYLKFTVSKVMENTDSGAVAQSLIQSAYENMKEIKPEMALEKLEQALRADYRQQEALYALKCLNWWLEKIKTLDGNGDAYGKGKFLLSQWKNYYGFLGKIEGSFDLCQYAIKHFVYNFTLQNYREALTDGVMRHDPGLFEQIGCCYKAVGCYDQALEYLSKAAQFKQEDGRTLAELADVYSLLGEAKAAKALFREAFFIDPQGVDLRSLESDMILALVKKVSEMGYSGEELLEWIPVYGSLLGVFSIKRDLKLSELGKLKEDIFYTESELRSNPGDEKILVPALLNKYLRLLEHYERGGDNRPLIDEIKLKIKIIKPVIFERYMR